VAGSAFQLAQLELLFANLLAVFPLTAATIARVLGKRLVESYYRALANLGPLSRASLRSPLSVSDTLNPYICQWIDEEPDLSPWQRRLLTGTLRYEAIRVGFMAAAERELPDLVLRESNWVAFNTDVDVVFLIQLLADGEELAPGVCKNEYVIFTRNSAGTVRGFALGEQSMERLRTGDPELVRMLEERAAA